MEIAADESLLGEVRDEHVQGSVSVEREQDLPPVDNQQAETAQRCHRVLMSIGLWWKSTGSYVVVTEDTVQKLRNGDLYVLGDPDPFNVEGTRIYERVDTHTSKPVPYVLTPLIPPYRAKNSAGGPLPVFDTVLHDLVDGKPTDDNIYATSWTVVPKHLPGSIKAKRPTTSVQTTDAQNPAAQQYPPHSVEKPVFNPMRLFQRLFRRAQQ